MAPVLRAHPGAAERREKRREAVVEAALRLFAERGHLNVRVEDIVEAAGVSRATFYKYFSERDEILAELFERLLGSGEPAVDPGRGSPEDVVGVLVLAARRMTEDEQLARFVYSVPIRHAALLPGRRAEPRVLDDVRLLIHRGVEGGLLRTDVEPDLLARHVAGAFESAMRDWAEGRAPDAERHVRTVLGLVFDGLRRPGSG